VPALSGVKKTDHKEQKKDKEDKEDKEDKGCCGRGGHNLLAPSARALRRSRLFSSSVLVCFFGSS
jgi:hypothetical protein